MACMATYLFDVSRSPNSGDKDEKGDGKGQKANLQERPCGK